MNRFVSGRSRLFLFSSWAFAATLFADAGNIDDLFSSNIVIHDDDAASAAPGSVPLPDRFPLPPQGKSPSPPVRLILDQDSPSLAAEPDAVSLIAQARFSEEKIQTYEMVIDGSLLHIKLRTLLI